MINAGRKDLLPSLWAIFALFLLASISSPGFAGPIEDARAAFSRGDVGTVELYRPLAEKGSAEAQEALGFLAGAVGDTAESHKWFRKAAAQGRFIGAVDLGFKFSYGFNGFPTNYSEAVWLFRIGADQGNAMAQYQLGLRYANGQGVPQDFTEAAKWFRRAADQGEAFAQVILGAAYFDGRGVPQDYVLAHMWFNLAASRLPVSGEQNRDQAVQGRDAVAAEMAPGQIAEAQRLAREWKPK